MAQIAREFLFFFGGECVTFSFNDLTITCNRVAEQHEPHRHACEVRHVAKLANHEARKTYLQGVERARGAAAAQRLREDVWTLLKGLR